MRTVVLISDIKLIRTDTNFDLSQKAEKRYMKLQKEKLNPTDMMRDYVIW